MEDCVVCHDPLEDLPEVPKESDPEYSVKMQKARHFFTPCFHANICGECVTLLSNDPLCPTCRCTYSDIRPFAVKQFF